MPDLVFSIGAEPQGPPDQRIFGVAPALVINNVDLMSLGRVQLQFPWLPGFEPWARVAVLLAGLDRGTYFIPQIGDEVLVAFSHGDVREPYVIGCLWNMVDRPPVLAPTDSITKRIIRTPLGHTLEFDDLLHSITITSTTRQTVTIDPTKVEISTTGGTAMLSLDTEGNITMRGALSIKLEAPLIQISAATSLELSGGRAKLDGGGNCEIRALQVAIN